MHENVKLIYIFVSGTLKLIKCKMNVLIGYPLSYQWDLTCDRLPVTTEACSVSPACWCST